MSERNTIFGRRFFGLPTLGGWLTIANCAGWAALMLVSESASRSGAYGLAEKLQLLAIWMLSSPGIWALLCFSRFRWHSFEGILIYTVGIGLNSFLWGYGLAWVIRTIREAGRDDGQWPD